MTTPTIKSQNTVRTLNMSKRLRTYLEMFHEYGHHYVYKNKLSCENKDNKVDRGDDCINTAVLLTIYAVITILSQCIL